MTVLEVPKVNHWGRHLDCVDVARAVGLWGQRCGHAEGREVEEGNEGSSLFVLEEFARLLSP